MQKKLSEMSLEELWELFPIILRPYDPNWKIWCEEEMKCLKQSLPKSAKIAHIGSTSIETIYAKPIIDFIVEIDKEEFEVIDKIIKKSGYVYMCGDEKRRDYNKGYTIDGFAERVFHLHLRTYGDHDELYFRDYLIEHSDIAKEYEDLKLSLWKKYEHDRDGYTVAKSNFIKKWTEIAKLQYGDRYEKSQEQ